MQNIIHEKLTPQRRQVNNTIVTDTKEALALLFAERKINLSDIYGKFDEKDLQKLVGRNTPILNINQNLLKYIVNKYDPRIDFRLFYQYIKNKHSSIPKKVSNIQVTGIQGYSVGQGFGMKIEKVPRKALQTYGIATCTALITTSEKHIGLCHLDAGSSPKSIQNFVTKKEKIKILYGGILSALMAIIACYQGSVSNVELIHMIENEQAIIFNDQDNKIHIYMGEGLKLNIIDSVRFKEGQLLEKIHSNTFNTYPNHLGTRHLIIRNQVTQDTQENLNIEGNGVLI